MALGNTHSHASPSILFNHLRILDNDIAFHPILENTKGGEISTTCTKSTPHRNMSTEPAYKAIARKKLEQLESRIPKAWRLEGQWIPAGMLSAEESVMVTDKYDSVNVMDVPRKCGLLNAEELEITEKWDIKGLLQQVATGELSAREVSEAFCKVSFPFSFPFLFLSALESFSTIYSSRKLSFISILYTCKRNSISP